MIEKIDFETAKQMLEKHTGCVIADVREEEEYVTGHAADAVLLPVDTISAETAAEIVGPTDTPVMVYCRSGNRSALAAARLDALGYEKVYDLGSLSGWPYGLEY